MGWCANVREVGGTVVLAHGYGASQALWDKQLPALSRHNRVVLFDWDFTGGDDDDQGPGVRGRPDRAPGRQGGAGRRDGGPLHVRHGRLHRLGKEARPLLPPRPPLRIPQVSELLAAAAAAAAVQTSCSTSRGCRYINSPEEGYFGGFERAGIDGMLDAMASDFDAWVKGFVPNAVGDPASAPPVQESFQAMHPGVALELARMIFLGDQREALAAVTSPCTIVQVEGDFAAPPSVAEYMSRRMTSAAAADVVVIDSVGHFLQLVAPQQLLDVLEGVLRRHGGEDVEEEEQAAEVEVEADGSIDITA
ncbi:hypothetical protein HU200_019364 [Digitaria exilis]|uniref:AB hydrolase-1 domain-containing protein n=1 Tax=Digitaria exilis TaxID=1010633 RepID=A0A835KFL0_9POAL|nr:hypothetical protein HU200_019364 [Digitaria exilis]